MSIFRVIAGYTYGHADIVRRAMSKKKADVLMAEKGDFLKGAEANGVDNSIAEALFEDMSAFANYAFNKSHAAAYAVISYRTAYLKRRYTCEFMAALMTSVLGNQTKLAEYISECAKYGIKVLPPNINESHIYFHPNNGNIVFGLLALKNVGKQFVEAILKERASGDFKDFEDFIHRMSHYELNKRMVEALIKSGAFDGMGAYRSQLISSYEVLIDTIQQKDKNNVIGQLDMFSSAMAADIEIPKFDYPDINEYPLRERLMQERECSGMYFSGHLADGYSSHIRYLGATGIAEAIGREDITEKDPISVAGIVSSLNRKVTKKNTRMAFLTLEDRYGEIECIIFPSQLEKFSHLLRIEAPLFIQGAFTVREDEPPKIIANNIIELIDNNNFDEKVHAVKQEAKVAETPVSRGLEKKINKVFLRVPNMDCDLFRKAKNIVDIFEGQVQVIFYDTSEKIYKAYSSGMDASPYVIKELVTILGEENVVPK